MDAGIRYLGGPDAGPSRQAQAQVDPKRKRADTSELNTFGVSGIKCASTPARRSSGSESEEEASVMEPEPQAAVVKRERAPTPMDEEVNAKIMQLPIQEQRRSFLKILTQGHYVAIDRNTGHRRCGFQLCWQEVALGFHVRSLLSSLLISFRAHSRTDSDGTSEVSLESEPGDQSVAGATFLG